jgi:hypothetical protein
MSEPSHLLTCSDKSSGQCLGNVSGTNKSDSHHLRVFCFSSVTHHSDFRSQLTQCYWSNQHPENHARPLYRIAITLFMVRRDRLWHKFR